MTTPLIAPNNDPSAVTEPITRSSTSWNETFPAAEFTMATVFTSLPSLSVMSPASEFLNPRTAAVMTSLAFWEMPPVEVSIRTVALPAEISSSISTAPLACSVMSPFVVATPIVCANRVPSAATVPTVTPLTSRNFTVPPATALNAANVATSLASVSTMFPALAFLSPSAAAVIVLPAF